MFMSSLGKRVKEVEHVASRTTTRVISFYYLPVITPVTVRIFFNILRKRLEIRETQIVNTYHIQARSACENFENLIYSISKRKLVLCIPCDDTPNLEDREIFQLL